MTDLGEILNVEQTDRGLVVTLRLKEAGRALLEPEYDYAPDDSVIEYIEDGGKENRRWRKRMSETLREHGLKWDYDPK